ncbi:MAG: hypothetical protein R2849_11615 [Thermomicrobiales bacterium]
MVVVAAGAHEQCSAHEVGGDIEPERSDIERLGSFEVAHPKVDVADLRAVRHARPAVLTVIQQPEQVLEIDRVAGHPNDPVVDRPGRAGPIGIDLYSVSVRIVEVERLADGMVRLPERQSAIDQMPGEACQVRTRRQQDREVVETGSALGSAGQPGNLPQHDDRLVRCGSAQSCLPAAPINELESHQIAVEPRERSRSATRIPTRPGAVAAGRIAELAVCGAVMAVGLIGVGERLYI